MLSWRCEQRRWQYAERAEERGSTREGRGARKSITIPITRDCACARTALRSPEETRANVRSRHVPPRFWNGNESLSRDGIFVFQIEMQNALITDGAAIRISEENCSTPIRIGSYVDFLIKNSRQEKVVWNISYRSWRGRYRKINIIVVNMFIAIGWSEPVICDKGWVLVTRCSLEKKIKMICERRIIQLRRRVRCFMERLARALD